jgi:DNA polymerase-3 subunit beta
MQLVKAPRDAILRPLQVVSGIVERRQTLPILANVLLRREGDRLSFTATDLEIQIQTHADFGPGREDATTTVSARKLVEILRALPDVEVQLSLANRKLSVQAGRSKFQLQTLPAEEYPTVAQATAGADFTVPASALKYLLSMVQYAMAAQDIRYYLNGMLLVVDGRRVRGVATDGHRLALCEFEREEQDPAAPAAAPMEVIVPRKTVQELTRLLPDGDEPVRIQVAPSQVRFAFGSIEFVSKLVEGKFPDYTKVIPTANTKNFVIDRSELMQSLSRTAILTTDKFKGVRWVLAPGSLKVSSTNTDQEEALEEIEVEYAGDSLDIGFNVTYLLDVLSNLKADQVKVSLGDALGSALITLPESERFKYVVMPMRI